MTDSSKDPKRPTGDESLRKALDFLLGYDSERLAKAERNAGNLAEQIVALSNEYLAASKEHNFGQVTLALIQALGSVIAQQHPDDNRGLLKMMRATVRELEVYTINSAQALHCHNHHSEEKHK